MKKIIVVVLIVVGLLAVLNLLGPRLYSKQEESITITVGAASDLRFAFEEIGGSFEKETGIKVVFQFGSSGNLAQQVANGAPIDLFASANKQFVEDLIEKGYLIEESKALYGIGRIVLATNNKSGIEINTLEELLSDEIDKISIANPSHAPYGKAAKEALESIGIWDRIEHKMVYGENVSQAMQFVQTGNAPVGIIARSVADVPEISYILVEEELHNPLEQMLGVVQSSKNKEAAQQFADFVNSPKGRAIKEKYGFHFPNGGEK